MHLQHVLNDIALEGAGVGNCSPEERAVACPNGLLRSIIETAPGLIYAKDRLGRLLIVNSAALEVIGRPWAEVRGRTDVELLPDRVQGETVMANDRAVMEGGRTQEVEEWVSRPGRPPTLFLSKKAPMRDAAGAVIGLVGVSVDITDRKAAAAELTRLNADLEARVRERTAERDRAWRNSQDLLCVVDAEGLVRAVNPAWVKALGRTPEEAIGRHHLTFSHPDDRPVSEAAHATASSGPLQTVHIRMLHKDGSIRWVAWVAASEGGLIYASGRDVTAERAASDALAEAGERLRQAQKMSAVGQLTGGIAHDLNNMLQGMSGAVDLMKQRVWAGQFGDLERYLAVLAQSVERGSTLTRGLLAFSRRQALAPSCVAPDELVSGIVALLRRTVGPNVTVTTRLKPGCWPIRCDRNQLESALVNLAINARDAMQPGGGSLCVTTDHAVLGAGDIGALDGARPGEFVRVSVRDTGAGMTPDVLRHAFEPFFTTKPVGQGTGLGLSQVFGFVNQSDGLVRLESVVGGGTTVHLFLPRFVAAGGDGTEGSARAAPEEAVPLSAATVLLVEDEADIRGLAADMLRDQGCTVLEAQDGAAGLAILRAGDVRIDLLVADVGLPGGMNGRQLAEAGRAMLPHLPVILITGFGGVAVERDGGLPPGVELLLKPFPLDALVSRVQAVLVKRDWVAAGLV